VVGGASAVAGAVSFSAIDDSKISNKQ
jgi:hypothetical protein